MSCASTLRVILIYFFLIIDGHTVTAASFSFKLLPSRHNMSTLHKMPLPARPTQHVSSDVCVTAMFLNAAYMILLLEMFLSVAVSIEPAFNLSVRRSPTLALGDVAVLVWLAVSGIRGSIPTSCETFTKDYNVRRGPVTTQFIVLIFLSPNIRSIQNTEIPTHEWFPDDFYRTSMLGFESVRNKRIKQL